MKNKIAVAQLICKVAHAGQKDLGGCDYWLHPFTVAKMVRGKKYKIVAYLHDVIEDTSVDYSLLSKYFTDDIVQAVRAITHAKNEPYMPNYMDRVKQNKYATVVKIADMEHNSILSRLSQVTEKDCARVAKYERCIAYLAQTK